MKSIHFQRRAEFEKDHGESHLQRRNELLQSLEMPKRNEGSISVNFLGITYTRVGDVACFKVGRLFLYRRIGDYTLISPHFDKKGA